MTATRHHVLELLGIVLDDINITNAASRRTQQAGTGWGCPVVFGIHVALHPLFAGDGPSLAISTLKTGESGYSFPAVRI